MGKGLLRSSVDDIDDDKELNAAEAAGCIKAKSILLSAELAK